MRSRSSSRPGSAPGSALGSRVTSLLLRAAGDAPPRAVQHEGGRFTPAAGRQALAGAEKPWRRRSTWRSRPSRRRLCDRPERFTSIPGTRRTATSAPSGSSPARCTARSCSPGTAPGDREPRRPRCRAHQHRVLDVAHAVREATARVRAALHQHVHALCRAEVPLARREAHGFVLARANAGEREDCGVRAGHGVGDLPHRRADAFLGAQPREHALVVHELPDGAVAARLERDRHILLLGDHPRAAAHGHHGHERLLEEPEPALAAAEKRLLFHERGDARVVALRRARHDRHRGLDVLPNVL